MERDGSELKQRIGEAREQVGDAVTDESELGNKQQRADHQKSDVQGESAQYDPLSSDDEQGRRLEVVDRIDQDG